MTEVKLKENEITVKKDSSIAKFLAGCKGKITIKSPYLKDGKREITTVKDEDGNVLK